jgi:hypothetical protein
MPFLKKLSDRFFGRNRGVAKKPTRLNPQSGFPSAMRTQRPGMIPAEAVEIVPHALIPQEEISVVLGEEDRPLVETHLDDPEERFIYEGEWTSNFTSSNVSAYHYDLRGEYDNAPNTLVIEFHDGSFYSYHPVPESLARSLYNAGSKGTWVWDNLRVRGTVFGFQIPYFFMSGRSRAVRLWMTTQASRERHAAIGPEGEAVKGYHPLLNPIGQREPGPNDVLFAKIRNKGGRERGGANEAPGPTESPPWKLPGPKTEAQKNFLRRLLGG